MTVLDLRLAPAALAAWVAAWWLTGATHGPTWAVMAGGAGTVLVAGLGFVRWRHPALTHACLVGACVVAVSLSAHVHDVARAPVAGLADAGATAELTGRVASEPEPAPFGGGLRWVLAVDTVDARGVTTTAAADVELTAPSPAPRYGARVAVSARLRPADAGEAVTARATAEAPAGESGPPGAVLRATHTLRSSLLDVTDGLSPQARGLVPGAAVGDTSRLPPELDDAMRVTGLTHVTAVSGGHFAVVVATLSALCGMLRLPRAARVGFLALGAVGFVLLVRPEPSVLRAAWTCAFALLGLALGRPSAGFAALAGASTVLLVVDPWLARSFGFALSCAATAGLVLFAGPLARRLAPWTGAPLAFALAVPLAAQAACGPVLVLLDPSLPVTSVPANLLAAPALVPATVLGLVATLLAPWAPAAAHGVAALAGVATSWIAAVARWFAASPVASLPWPGGVPGAVALALLTIVAVGAVLRRPVSEGWPRGWRELPLRVLHGGRRAVRRSGDPLRTVLLGAAVGAVVLVGIVVPQVLRTQNGGLPPDWEVVACDVGQGDALVLRSGPASAVVVDVGPPGDAAGHCLDRLGVERVDLLVLSHFHADHVGGLPAVLAGRQVDAALVSGLDAPQEQAAMTHSRLADARVPVQVADTGLTGMAGDVTWEVLGASSSGPGGPARAGEEGDGANDASIALGVRTARGVDIVALGDLEEAAQDALLADLEVSGGTAATDGVEVVKMPHHGSRSQSARLAAFLRPRVTVVSVGEDNTYGHPTDAALDLYAGLGSALVRTDQCGTAALVVRDGALRVACG